MKRIPASIFVFVTAIAPAIAAETTDRPLSLPDSNPECMQVNGPDCVLRSQVVPLRTEAPQGVVVVPTPVPPITTAPVTPTFIAPGTPAVMAPGTPTVIAPASPAQGSTVIAPAQGSTVISPRR